MKTHYGPWQPCWISNQHQKHKSGRGPSSEHFWQVWLISVQRIQRRRFKYEKLTDGRMTDAYPWQKLTWPMARWAKNQLEMKIFHSHQWCFTWRVSLVEQELLTIPEHMSSTPPPPVFSRIIVAQSSVICVEIQSSFRPYSFNHCIFWLFFWYLQNCPFSFFLKHVFRFPPPIKLTVTIYHITEILLKVALNTINQT